MKNIPAFIIVSVAYGVPFQGSSPISGFPDWARAERFDIEATAAEGAIPLSLSVERRDAKMGQMLQALLADRFQLKIRHETKEAPVYELVAGKNGPQDAEVQNRGEGLSREADRTPARHVMPVVVDRAAVFAQPPPTWMT